MKKLYTTPVEKGFDALLTKAKKGALTKEERVQARITEGIQIELSMVDSSTVDQNQWVEGWRPECLAFRYFNILQMYKAKYNKALELHSKLMEK